MMGAVASFSLMAVAGREVSFELDTFEIMLFRSLVGLVIVLLVASASRTVGQINTGNMGLHLTRNLFHFAGQNLWFYAIALIPLAQVFALEFTTPIWVLLISPILLGERLTRMRIFAAVLGFIGILLVARPEAASLNAGTISAALAAIGFAGSITLTKKLTQVQSLTCILFWMTLIQSVFGLIAAGYDGDISTPSAASLPWLGVIAFCGLSAHFCITSALATAPATLVAPLDFIRLPVIALIGLILYQEPLDAFIILGAVVIFSANYLNVLSETRKGS
ncbi:MAG: DMT family transporter [Pseudomonadota bacterium]